MKIKFYGTRGSIPVCEKGFQEFGGNTTCVAVYGYDPLGSVLIFDAGTGIRKLGKDLKDKKFGSDNNITIAFSHFHWDHIQGFPFFNPAYDPSVRIQLVAMGKDLEITDLKSIFTRQMESTFFPVALDNMGANFSFIVHKKDLELTSNGRFIASRHSHPGGAYGYRLEADGKSMVFCTDVEHGDKIDQGVVGLARNADVLIHEAQYTPEELPKYKGWGHSSWKQAIEVAKQAGVKQLYLTHHDPDHDDEFLRREELRCQREFPQCYIAREGTEIVIK